MMVRQMDKREDKMQRVLKDFFNNQKNRIISKVKNRPEQQSFKKKNLLWEVFGINEETKIAASQLIPLLREFVKEQGAVTLDRMDYDFDFTLTSDIESWIDKRTNTFSRQFNKTTADKLEKEFKESFAEGESRQQLVERIENTYDGFTENRANTIARTEVHSATNKANFESYNQTRTPTKIWTAVMDARTRRSHVSLDGEERPMDMPFSNGLMYPGDPSGRPGEFINCRCVI